ncbi:hypothetical protein FJ250_11540 [bacterium]|nr:hypothetical protein [bacterium]
MRSARRPFLLAMLAVAVAAPRAVPAADGPEAVGTALVADAGGAAAAGAQPPVATAPAARRAAFDAVLAEEDALLQSLTARLAGADSRTALEIHRQIAQVKARTWRRLLEVQLDLAAMAGDQAAVAKLQAALADWDAPPPAREPVARPVPHNPAR